jgi:hypothetical protein
MPVTAVLHHLLSLLDKAAEKAIESNPVTVFESVLASIVSIVFLSLDLQHVYKMRRLERAERRDILATLVRLNLPTDPGAGDTRQLSWLFRGGRRWRR